MAIKMIALDLDGTLLTSEKNISERTRNILEECGRRGIFVVPATGRALHAVPELVLGLSGVRYGIFTNGSCVWDLKEGKQISESCMDWQAAVGVVKILREFPMIYDVYVDGRGVCEAHFLETLEEFGLSEWNCRYIRSTRRTVEDLAVYLEREKVKVQKMNLTFRDRETKAEVRKRLEEMEEVLVTSSLPYNLEINAAGTTKGSGLAFLRSYLGVERDEVMAFGDGENDLPLLQAAGIGVAMGNGAPFLKERADEVTLTNDEDGVAEMIEKYL